MLHFNLGLLVLERVRRQSNANFVNAIIQCITSVVHVSTTTYQNDICDSLCHAINMIETKNELQMLFQHFIADITNYYTCDQCQQTSQSLSSRKKQIYLFMKSSKNTFRTACAITAYGNQLEPSSKCAACQKTSFDQILNIESQVFHKCPEFIISLLDEDIQKENLFDYAVQMNDEKKNEHRYHTESLIFISKYSNSITVVRRESNIQYLAFHENPYSNGQLIDEPNLTDLYYTSSNVLIFLRKASVSFPTINRSYCVGFILDQFTNISNFAVAN